VTYLIALYCVQYCVFYCVLCTVYCVLSTEYCVLSTVYCVLCTVYNTVYSIVYCILYWVLSSEYCVLCTVYCVLCAVLCILLCAVYCTEYWVLCTEYCVLCTVLCILLCTVYCVLCTVYSTVYSIVYWVLSTEYWVLCTVYCVLYCVFYCVLSTVYCILSTEYCVLCTVLVTGRWMLRVAMVSPAWNITRRVQCFLSSSLSRMKDLITSAWYGCSVCCLLYCILLHVLVLYCLVIIFIIIWVITVWYKMLVCIISASQGSVETRLRCGGISNDSFVAFFRRVCQWKNYENPLKIDEVIELAQCTSFFWKTVYKCYYAVSVQVAEAVFQFLSMLRQAGPQKYIHDEIKTIEDNEFRFEEPVSSLMKVTDRYAVYSIFYFASFQGCCCRSLLVTVDECKTFLAARRACWLGCTLSITVYHLPHNWPLPIVAFCYCQ